ncbi:MAG TPA: ABC transporter substrate-binding protein [Pseudonocardia sp.]|uniref:ABC transporter substrate-binding protein n=1 Tax=Pseudonocardia sp. TaxID=60912 RepID=UPI002B4B91CC|nr:ABC transporter substrate-binding protein [Pseudonocardia sp.]HLU57998.1 ABC transporter substrate-binding protein [Pseudonocardia sp.]
MRLIGLLLCGLLAVTACSTPAPEPTGTGGWSYTDDLGNTVTLDERPTRIAGLTDVVASLWNYGIEPVAAFGYTAISQDQRFAGRDLSGVTELGMMYGQIDLEALAAAEPDLIVTHAYPVDAAGTIDPQQPLYGFADLAQQEAVARIAPIVAITMDGSAVQVIDRTAQLALALGADPAVVTGARAEYDAAADRLRAAATSGLQVLVVAAYPDEGFYVAKAPDDPALTSYADLGVNFVDPGGTDYYWEVVSWENVGSLPADVVLESQLDEMTAEQIIAQPTFARTPAGQARQVYPWVFASMDYAAQAAYMNELAGHLESARKVA